MNDIFPRVASNRHRFLGRRPITIRAGIEIIAITSRLRLIYQSRENNKIVPSVIRITFLCTMQYNKMQWNSQQRYATDAIQFKECNSIRQNTIQRKVMQYS